MNRRALSIAVILIKSVVSGDGALLGEAKSVAEGVLISTSIGVETVGPRGEG